MWKVSCGRLHYFLPLQHHLATARGFNSLCTFIAFCPFPPFLLAPLLVTAIAVGVSSTPPPAMTPPRAHLPARLTGLCSSGKEGFHARQLLLHLSHRIPCHQWEQALQMDCRVLMQNVCRAMAGLKGSVAQPELSVNISGDLDTISIVFTHEHTMYYIQTIHMLHPPSNKHEEKNRCQGRGDKACANL